MPLSDSEIRSFQATDKRQKASCGDSLYLVVEPDQKGGGKSFIAKTRFPPGRQGKWVEVRIGKYGKGVGRMSLKQARDGIKALTGLLWTSICFSVTAGPSHEIGASSATVSAGLSSTARPIAFNPLRMALWCFKKKARFTLHWNWLWTGPCSNSFQPIRAGGAHEIQLRLKRG